MSKTLRCGLLGEKLGHSYSPAIHAELADYDYKIFEVAPDDLENFILHGEWDCLNVTIPYKKAVMPYCSELSQMAAKIGSVNVLVRHEDGRISGDNTDAFGFAKLVERTGVDPKGKKAVILGNGGACRPVDAVLTELGAKTVIISRSGENNYDNLYLHYDAEIVANTTPVGMYPGNGKSVVELRKFKNCKALMELIYNPARTELMLQAEELGIASEAGLCMLVAQAKRACEIFTGKSIADSEIDRIEKKLSADMQNIVLVGMPGCGKTTLAGILGNTLNRPVFETDKMIVEKAGMTIPEIFEKYGEAEFRRLESEIMEEVGKKSGAIISTGGGCVTVPANYKLLHQNGRIVWLRRKIENLSKEGRPISQKSNLFELYEARKAAYERFADYTADNDTNPEATARDIIKMIGE